MCPLPTLNSRAFLTTWSVNCRMPACTFWGISVPSSSNSLRKRLMNMKDSFFS